MQGKSPEIPRADHSQFLFAGAMIHGHLEKSGLRLEKGYELRAMSYEALPAGRADIQRP